MKRLCAVLLLALLACALCSPAAVAAPALSWVLDEDTLVLSGSGVFTDYSDAADAPWYASRAQIRCIVVESGITAVGDNSFVGCENLTQVYLPDGLTSIGKNAFWGCTALSSIALPATLDTIGTCAFFRCGLTAVTIPEQVRVLEQGVFGQCEALTRVTLPDDMTAIGKDAFSRCYRLQTLQLPQGLQQLGEHALFACIGLRELEFPVQFRQLGSAAFYGCTALRTLRFCGDAPDLAADAFLGLTATVEYPRMQTAWRALVDSGYGGDIVWNDFCTHSFTDYVSDANATADADGTKTARCDYGCGATDTVPDAGSRLNAVLRSDVYTIEEEVISGIPPQTSAAAFLAGFPQSGVRLLRGSDPVSGGDPVGTGMVVQLLSGETVADARIVLVRGDVSGDGTVSITDLLAVKAHLLGKSTLGGIYAQAADVSGDHSVSITDFLQIKAMLLAK